jgi:hypothetical protein
MRRDSIGEREQQERVGVPYHDRRAPRLTYF